MNDRFTMRRTVLAAVAVGALVAAWPALAQDPRANAARAAALAWLEFADANNGRATYETSADRFRSTVTLDQWTEALAAARARFGTLTRRTLVSATAPDPGKDTPPGEFEVVMFRTEFSQREGASETLTLERESDGVWRVVGYLMR
jgi:hypothetical protein